MTIFEGVAPALGRALADRGYTTLTPVQLAMLEPNAHGADLLVSAQTGSGKTVAFGIGLAPTLLGEAETFDAPGPPLALVVAPTRELAQQVCRELEWLYAPTGARIRSCIGGMDMRDERRALAGGAHIVVGTPGRLRDHIERGSLDISGLRAVVLDEADEMLDLGFREDLEFILGTAPEDRRTLLFSATVSKPIAALAKRFQHDAVRISTGRDNEQHRDIEYHALLVAPNERENAIINVLRYHDAKSAMVFCGTREMVKHLSARLANRGFSVVALSGELDQHERNRSLQAMRDGRARVCVATDVASRGIDLPNLELVIHADMPVNREGLLHRSGRTGRAGRKGVCALIVPHSGRRVAERLLNAASVKAVWSQPPQPADILARDNERILGAIELGDPPSAEEMDFVRGLLARHSAEQIATAWLRQQRAAQPAPEELLESGAAEAPAAPRGDFGDAVWFRLSAGRKHNAEARWLLPLICRAGHVTKRDVGSIRVFEVESHFQIVRASADRFMEAVKRGGTGEKSITIARMDEGDAPPARAQEARPQAPRAPEARPQQAPASAAHPRPAWKKSSRPYNPAGKPKPGAAPKDRARRT